MFLIFRRYWGLGLLAHTNALFWRLGTHLNHLGPSVSNYYFQLETFVISQELFKQYKYS